MKILMICLAGKPSKCFWSPKMIRKVECVMKTESFKKVFQNFKFVVRRDIIDDIAFLIADFPNLNPHDLVVLLKLSKEWGLKPNSVVMQSIKAFLCYYYRDIARTDIVLAGVINQKVKLPNKEAEGIDNIGDGEIVTKPTWGSTYSARVAGGRSRKVFFRMNEKERFPNNVLEGMIQRIMLNSKNSESVRKKAVDMLRWWLKIREVLLKLVHKGIRSSLIMAYLVLELDFQILIGVERFRCPEILFHPNLIGIEQAGLDEMAGVSMQRLKSRAQRLDLEEVVIGITNSVLITGGSCLYPGMSERLEAGIRMMRPCGTPIRIFKASDAVLDTWRGKHPPCISHDKILIK
uniref:Uncharacterized protein n=1 Tax=Lactuca sativa TaxID=4236 RepID=A0A9R1UJE6_LACSA|nr:hypothetical protein LSAT_V11C900483350 [Lactuca sativa]